MGLGTGTGSWLKDVFDFVKVTLYLWAPFQRPENGGNANPQAIPAPTLQTQGAERLSCQKFCARKWDSGDSHPGGLAPEPLERGCNPPRSHSSLGHWSPRLRPHPSSLPSGFRAEMPLGGPCLQTVPPAQAQGPGHRSREPAPCRAPEGGTGTCSHLQRQRDREDPKEEGHQPEAADEQGPPPQALDDQALGQGKEGWLLLAAREGARGWEPHGVLARGWL